MFITEQWCKMEPIPKKKKGAVILVSGGDGHLENAVNGVKEIVGFLMVKMEVYKVYDCGFTKGNHRFRFRTGGIIIKDNKMLFVKCNIGNYYYMIGGAVQLGETTEKCIEREIFEEAGIRVQVDCLAVVCENFFKGVGGVIDGFDCHTIEFYYLMKVKEEVVYEEKTQTDEGEQLVWLSIEDIPKSDIKPSFMKEYINEIINGDKIIHIIWEKDR